jgi:hypothetical protein
MHSICSEVVAIVPPLITGPCLNGLGGGAAAAPGTTYINMTNATGGIWRSICSSDWNPIFMAVAQAVGVVTYVPCIYDIPDPPMGMTLDPTQVNFAYTPQGGTAMVLPQVPSAADCGGDPGWYYDDPGMPTQILVCPATCDGFTSNPPESVQVQFGCATIVP